MNWITISVPEWGLWVGFIALLLVAVLGTFAHDDAKNYRSGNEEQNRRINHQWEIRSLKEHIEEAQQETIRNNKKINAYYMEEVHGNNDDVTKDAYHAKGVKLAAKNIELQEGIKQSQEKLAEEEKKIWWEE